MGRTATMSVQNTGKMDRTVTEPLRNIGMYVELQKLQCRIS